MRILFATSEAFPLIKTGGLADVSGSLPSALSNLGIDIRILIPGYPAVLQNLKNYQPGITIDQLPFVDSVKLVMGEMPDTGVPVMAIVAPGLYERSGGPYVDNNGNDWEDNPVRFGILAQIAALLSSADSPLTDWIPDIVHCNDWQTGLAPAFMHHMKARRPEMYCAKSIIGLHNLLFQGSFSPDWVQKLGFPSESFQVNGLEYYGQLSFLKAGIYYADSIITVSPTYAREIQTPEYGFGMQGLLATRSQKIRGILNGIDTQEWNPAEDSHIARHYDTQHLIGKKVVKRALQTQLGLAVDPVAPLLGVVSRLTHQKGLDMLLAVAEPLLQQGCQMSILGSGEAGLEEGFRQLATRYVQQVSTIIGYNERLSHRIMAGTDIFIMPSRFEPCGLNQMYGLRYGTPPLVTRTGGLADSVVDTNAETLQNGTANGFMMQAADEQQLLLTIERALALYRDSAVWHKIQMNGMQLDLGWDRSAKAYIDVYNSLLE